MEKFKEEFKRQLIEKYNCNNVEITNENNNYHLVGNINGFKLDYFICMDGVEINYLGHILRGVNEQVSIELVVNMYLDDLKEIKKMKKENSIVNRLKSFFKKIKTK